MMIIMMLRRRRRRRKKRENAIDEDYTEVALVALIKFRPTGNSELY